MVKRRDWVRKKVVAHKTTIMFKGGIGLLNEDEFARVFWKSRVLAAESRRFWETVRDSEPTGLAVETWRKFCEEKRFSVGQFYNMIHGLVGAGMLEKRGRCWHVSTGFLRELDDLTKSYSRRGGWSRVARETEVLRT